MFYLNPDLPIARAPTSGKRDPVLGDAANLPQNAAKQNIDFASNRNSESPTALRRKELLDEKNEIKAKQNAGKNSRSSKINEIKRLEAQIKTLEHKYDYVEEPLEKARDTMNLGPKGKRSLEERLDDAVRILQARCDSGTLRFAEQRETETKIVQFNTALEKKKEQQKPIDDLQAKIKEIKDSMDDPESKALNERWAAIQAELDTIHAEQAEKGKNLDSLHAERKELQNLQREKFAAKKNLGDEYYKQRNAWRDYDREQRAKAQERYRAEQERIRKERKLERAQKMLAEASDPAYLDEIRRANSLLQYFDPSFVPEKAPLQPTTNLQAQAERKVDASDLQGVKIMSKKDREEELFPAQKKGKKGKKGKKQDAAAAKTFNCPPSVLEDCSYLDIDPPMSAEEVPGVIEKVKSKLDNWKADQAAQTQKVRYASSNERMCFRADISAPEHREGQEGDRED